MNLSRASLSALVAAACLAFVPVAHADEAEQSRAYFEMGASEYEKGNYPNAIRAFEQAYNLTKRPGLLFSIAQSYRRQYAIDSKGQNLRKALEYYRQYLDEDKTGKRKGEASAAITEIQPMIAQLKPEEVTAPEAPAPTQLGITTNVDSEIATISIDGGQPRPLAPVEVAPDVEHKVLLQAPGYYPEERTKVPVAKGQLTLYDIQLRPKPALVSITGKAGAEVRVDGIPRGTLPLMEPLSVEAGERTITVDMNGYYSFSEERSLGRGESLSIKTDIKRTRQRVMSYVVTGGGVVIAGVGVLLALDAGTKFADAARLNQDRKRTFITDTQLDEYNTAKDTSSSRTVLASVALNTGIGLGALAFLLYYFDEPKFVQPKVKKDEKKPEKKDTMRDIAFVPAAGSGYLGATLTGRF